MVSFRFVTMICRYKPPILLQHSMTFEILHQHSAHVDAPKYAYAKTKIKIANRIVGNRRKANKKAVNAPTVKRKKNRNES